ncbi:MULTISPECIES: DUF3891 family protein [Salinibaculum]|uniref:DUF3891 family protein n=1 Tax=Salinibaculum TaxID=2732368 RepID=UPI0030D0DDD5
MLIAERDARYRFVTQPAHARVAGRLAEHWGGDGFDRPEPSPAVVTATYNHDNGWWRYDRQPHRDASGDLVGVRDVPPARWVEFYEDGIDSVVDLDPYAGVLASLHGSGLRRRRYGLSDATPPEHDSYERFVADEEARQRRLVDEMRREGDERVSERDAALLESLHESGTPADEGSRLWRNYALLQAWDRLSLAVCATLPPGETTEIPLAGDETLTVAAVDGTTFEVEPYPFASDSLVVRVPARRVEKTAVETGEDLAGSYYGTPRESLAVTLRGKQ